MPEEPKDVTPAAEPSTAEPTDAAPVNADPVLPDDRPVTNIVAEFNRKIGSLQQKMETLAQMITMNQVANQPVSVSGKPATDEELWELAKQGNREAFETYQRRIAQKEIDARLQVDTRSRSVEAQLQVLAQRYPILNDASHPLSQAVTAEYQAFVGSGEAPSRSTLLEALKSVITYRSDLMADVYAQSGAAGKAVRASATHRALAGQTGTSVHSSTAPVTTPKFDKKTADLAKRIGVTDPVQSMERFYKRREEGKSALGAVANYIEMEE